MTNLEWVRKLSAEKLANKLHEKPVCQFCANYNYKTGCMFSVVEDDESHCVEGMTKWLKTEHVPELKPCPFCGSEDVYLHSKDGYADLTTVIFCNACKSTVFIEDNEEEGYDDKTREKAIEAWNRRVSDD